MNLKEALLAEHSKEQVGKIVAYIGEDERKLAELMRLFLHDEYRVVQRAAWVVSSVAQSQPRMVHPYLSRLVSRLGDEDIHVAVKRNVLRILQDVPLEQHIQEPLMNHCFDYLTNYGEALAVRAFALSLLARLALVYPELNNELKMIIEDALQHEPAASFKSRAKKVLKQIETGKAAR